MISVLEYSTTFYEPVEVFTLIEMRITMPNRRSPTVDRALLEMIKAAPGLSLYELHNRLKWSIGRVDGSKNRLLASKKIIVTEIDRNGRHVALVYPRPRNPQNSVTIPKSLLHMSNPAWKHQAIFYALDSLSIGITGERYPEWEKGARFKEKIKPHYRKGNISLKIPQTFVEFYGLENKHVTKSVADNHVLLTIDGNIVKELP